MQTVKMNKKGQIRIPEALREKYGWDAGIRLEIAESQTGILTVAPEKYCRRCGKAIEGAGVCPYCPRGKIIEVYQQKVETSNTSLLFSMSVGFGISKRTQPYSRFHSLKQPRILREPKML